MKNVTSTNEPMNLCSDESDGRHRVMFASGPYPRLFPRQRKKAVREGLGTRLLLQPVELVINIFVRLIRLCIHTTLCVPLQRQKRA